MWKIRNHAPGRRRKILCLAVLLTAVFELLPGGNVQAAPQKLPFQLASGTNPGTTPTNPGTTPGTDPGTTSGTTPGTDPGTTPGTTSGTDSQTGEATNSWPISTQLTGQGRNVTLTVDISENSQVSSGRIKIHYAPDMLRLTGSQSGNLWALEDINTGLSEAGQSVAAFAWADTQKLTSGGRILTLTWEAQDKANGQELIVETEMEEMFSGEQPLSITSGLRIDRLRTSFQVNQPGTAGNTSTGTGTTTVRTGDDSNMIGYILLCMGAALVMAVLIRRRLKGR